jgi:hypothetical protein
MTSINNNNIKTYRHEFGKEFMAELSSFSKVHQYDDRHTYKNEWAKWTQQDDIAQAMDIEKRRLEENGYKGDIADKMFKAGRYYFRKKSAADTAALSPTAELSVPDLPTPRAASSPTAELSVPDLPTPRADTADTTPPGLLNSSAKAEQYSAVGGRTPPVMGRTPPSQRRPYITMSKSCIKMMDEHILNASASSTSEFKPSSCYSDFYQTKMTSDDMTKEIGHIIEKYEKTPGAMTNISPEELTNQIMDKIKKTYKNRYYKYTSSAIINNNTEKIQ